MSEEVEAAWLREEEEAPFHFGGQDHDPEIEERRKIGVSLTFQGVGSLLLIALHHLSDLVHVLPRDPSHHLLYR